MNKRMFGFGFPWSKAKTTKKTTPLLAPSTMTFKKAPTSSKPVTVATKMQDNNVGLKQVAEVKETPATFVSTRGTSTREKTTTLVTSTREETTTLESSTWAEKMAFETSTWAEQTASEASPWPEQTASEAPTWPEQTASEAPTRAEQTSSEAPTRAEQTSSEAPTRVEQTALETSTWAEQTASEASPWPEQTASEAPTWPEQTAPEAPTRAEQTPSEAPTRAEQTAFETPTRAEQTASEAPTRAEQTASETPTRAEQTASEAPTRAEQTASEAPTKAEQTASEAPTKAEQTNDTFSDLWTNAIELASTEVTSSAFAPLQRGQEGKEVLRGNVTKLGPHIGLFQRAFSMTMSIDQALDEANDLDAESAGTTESITLSSGKVESTIESTFSSNYENTSTSGATYKILKRDVDREWRTAKGVAALEIIVDLMKHKDGAELAKQTDTKFGASDGSESDDDIFTFRPPLNEATDASTNSIHVHIAIPYDNSLIQKRSAEPVLARKVFSARLASPVDLEYQIHYIDTMKPTRAQATSTPIQAEIVSPGLYLLVDNFNEGNNSFALKPVKISSVSYGADSVQKKSRNVSTNEQGVKLSKAFIRAVNKHLVDLYNNITEDSTKRITQVKREVVYPEYSKKVRDIFENDRACDCKCKVNEPMCGVCAASDAVIKELSFEFDNLSKYVNDHCTEIQTYFKVNPRGGKVLRDCIRKLDKSLNDYSKRSKGKCHGPKCKSFATYIHKRQDNHKSKTEVENLVDCVTSLNNNFYVLSNLIPYVETLKNYGDKFIKSAKNCIVANVKKRKCREPIQKDDVYTFDNISVKFICSPESTSDANNMPPINTAPTDHYYMDYGFKKRSLKPNILNKFFSRKKKQNKKSSDLKKKHKKRQADQVESPLIADAGGSFWRDYILRKITSKPKIVISVVETKNKVKDRTTVKLKQKDNKIIKRPDTSSFNSDRLKLIATNETGDQESKSKLTTMNSTFWRNETNKTKPTEESNQITDKLYKKSKAKMYGNKINRKQQNKADAQYNITKPNVDNTVTDTTKLSISEIPTTEIWNNTLPIVTTSENNFIKKIKMTTSNFLLKMNTTKDAYQLDVDDFMRNFEQQREIRADYNLTAKHKSSTKQSLQVITQQTVTGNGKPKYVVVTKPITLYAKTRSKINNSKSMVLSMLNAEKKNNQNKKNEKLFGDVINNLQSSVKRHEPKHFDETTLTTAGNTIERWFHSDDSNDEKNAQGDENEDVFDELPIPHEAEEGAATIVWREDPISGKNEDGFLAKNWKLVFRQSNKSMSTFAPEFEKEQHTETTKTTDIIDATWANVEEADPFKTRVAEMSSSAFVSDPCSSRRSKSHYNINKRENLRQQDQNDISRVNKNKRYDNVRIYRRINLKNNNGVDGRHFGKPSVKMNLDSPGFDSYVRGDHGDYRIERDRRKPSATRHVYVEKKMQKRSSSKVNTDLSSLSGWVQHVTISHFLASCLCFYLCCAALAAGVSRAFTS